MQPFPGSVTLCWIITVPGGGSDWPACWWGHASQLGDSGTHYEQSYPMAFKGGEVPQKDNVRKKKWMLEVKNPEKINQRLLHRW